MTEEQLIEAMARAMFKGNQVNRLDIAKAALAVARPIIEAQERERCARIADKYEGWSGAFIAAAIRDRNFQKQYEEFLPAALKETGDE